MKTACENATRRTTWLGSSDLLSACSSSKTTSTVSRCGDELLDGTSTTSQKYWESPCYSVRLPWVVACCHQTPFRVDLRLAANTEATKCKIAFQVSERLLADREP